MSRSTVFQRPQIGPEVTYNVPVGASKWLQATSIRMRANIPVDDFRPSGLRFPTDAIPQKGMGTFNYEGRINPGGDLVYILSSLLAKVTPTGVGPYVWTFEPPTAAPPTGGVQSFTLQTGSSQGAEQMQGCLFDGVEFTWNRTTSAMRGTGFGKAYTPGATLTASPTAVSKALAQHGKVDVEVGDTIGGLTKLTKCLDTSLFIRNGQAGVFYMDASEDEFSDTVYRAPEVGGRIQVEQDSTAVTFLANLKASTQKFCRITSYGPLGVSAGTALVNRYRMQATFPFKFRTQDTGDDQDVETGIFDLLPNHDDGYGKAVSVVVTNLLAAL